MALAGMTGSMSARTRDNGSIIIWMVLEYIIGLMVEYSLGSTLMIKSMVMASMSGKTADGMRVIGLAGGNMVSERI